MTLSPPLEQPLRSRALLILRVTLGWFLVVWGLDKILNAGHAVAVSDGFYLGLFSHPLVVSVGGVLEVALGSLVIAGLFRSVSYAGALLVYTVTLLGVWKSIVDPLELVIDGGNLVFGSSAVIWAASFYLWTTRNEAESTAL